MGVRSLLSLVAAATAVMASPDPLAARGDAKKIEWGACDKLIKGADNMECGSLEVPRDYTDEGYGAKTLNLSLAKVPAPKDSKGSILFNFGGPGSPGLQSLGESAKDLQIMTGGQYDLVTFNPRGTGNTMFFSCFEDYDDEALFFAKFPMDYYGTSDVTGGDLWANAGAFADRCNETMGDSDEAELIGTAFVARDMMQIVDALGGDGMLRFWGMSYGTVLGATAAAMFPDRIDKMVLDGVTHPKPYYHSYYMDPDEQAGAEAVWNQFLEECIKAGDKCALSSLNDTASDLADTLERTAESYRTDPVTVDGYLINYSSIRDFYYTLLRSIDDLPSQTEALAALVARENLAEYAESTFDGSLGDPPALYGIGCSDAIPRAASRDGVMEEVEDEMGTSRLAGFMPYSTMLCAQWPWEAKERQTVDGTVDTKNPVLLVGNTYDVVTPVKSAYSLSKQFPGSAVIEQKGWGHTSMAQVSKCTIRAIADYFTNGTLPNGNAECEVDTPLFPDT